MNPKTKWLTPGEAATLLGVTTRTIYQWLREGKIKGRKIGTHLWRIREDKLPIK